MAAYVPYPFHGNPKAYLWSELNRIAAAIAGGGITNLSPASAAVVLTPNPILGAGTIGVSANLNAYSGGDTPSAFTLGIVDSVDAAAWRAAIGAGTGSGTVTSVGVGTGLVATPSPIVGAGTISLDTVLAAYAGGDTPSAFTLGIVDSVDAAAWRTAIGAGTSSAVGANPTGTIGLSAVNGSATTFLRSDGAPALDQAIAPTWTGKHIFSKPYLAAGDEAILMSGNPVVFGFNDTSSPADRRRWTMAAVGGAGKYSYSSANDAGTIFREFFAATRSTGVAITIQNYGNPTDNPPHIFHGPIWSTFYASSTPFTGALLDYVPSGTGTGPYARVVAYTSASVEQPVYLGTAKPFVHAEDGRIYGTGLHNNAGAVTGTTNQYIASGTYTPTGTNVANAGSLSMSVAQWMRVGNVVTVSGSFTFTAAGTATTTVGISLPIASALASAGQLAGSAAREETAGVFAASVITDATNDRAQVQLGAIVAAAACTVHYTFTYVVV